MFNVLNDEALEIIETNAEAILEDVGVNFVNNPAALKRWQDAGADVDGERVRSAKGVSQKSNEHRSKQIYSVCEKSFKECRDWG